MSRNVVVYYEGEETGGTTGIIGSLVRLLSPEFKTTLVYRNNPALTAWAGSLAGHGSNSVPLALRNRSGLDGWFDLRGLIRLAVLFRRAGLIHFHQHTAFACLPAIVLAGITGRARVVTTEHYITQLKFLRRRKLRWPLSVLRGMRIRLLLQIKKYSFRFIDRVVAVSDANGSYLRSVFSEAASQKLLVIPNGIDPAPFAAPRPLSAAPAIKGMDWANRSPVIAVVAGLNNQKGHDVLLRAIPDVVAFFPKVVFLFVGDGHLRSSLESRASELAVQENVVFAGKRNDVPQILEKADLFVLPSLFEGMPLSVLEAMAAGKAVVATAVDGTAEVVADTRTGFLVAPGDSAALSDRIIRLLQDPETRSVFGQQGRRRVMDLFDARAMAERYRALYRELDEEHHPL